MVKNEIHTSSPEKANERQSVNWDLQNAFGNYSVLIITQVCVALFSFSSVWIINRFLGTDGYGNIIAVIAASQSIQVLITWTTVSVSKFGTEEFIDKGKISKPFWNRTYFLIPNIAVVLFASFLWFEPLSKLLKIQTEFFPFIIAHIISTIFWLHIQFALQGSKLLKAQGILAAIEKTIVFISLLILCLTSKITWFTALSVYIIAPSVMILIGLWQLRSLIFPISKIDFGYIRKILLFSLPFLPSSLVGYFSTSYLDVFFISQYLTKTDVGIYSVVYQIIGIFMQVPILAGSVLMPMFVTMQSTDNNRQSDIYLSKILPLICFTWTLVCALAATIGGFVLPMVFGENFTGVYALLWTMMVTASVSGPLLWGYAVMANAKSLTYLSTVNAVVATLLNVVLNYLLIPRFGLVGCAWATGISTFVATSIFIILLNKHLQLKKTWAMQATLPILSGAIYILIYKADFGALIITMLSSLFFLFIHHKSFSETVYIIRGVLFSKYLTLRN